MRQTHTAITAYWLMRGSPWLAYETPILGAPWSLPLEFPFYQLLVAKLAGWTGLSLDSIGRLVSYLFVVLTIIPVRMLARAWKLDDTYVRVFAILLLTSPIYLFWGTAFLIETFVVFFCFWFLAEVELATRSSHWTALALSILCGTVAALGKIMRYLSVARSRRYPSLYSKSGRGLRTTRSRGIQSRFTCCPAYRPCIDGTLARGGRCSPSICWKLCSGRLPTPWGF